MKHTRLHITPEALLEYLERVEGVDVEAARQSIARRVEYAADQELEGACGVIYEGFKYKLNDLTVTSVRPHHGVSLRTGGRRR